MVLLPSRSPKRTNLQLPCLWNRAPRGSYQISQHNLPFTLKLQDSTYAFLPSLVYQNHWCASLLQHRYYICNFQAHGLKSVWFLPLKLSCWTSCFHVLSILLFLLCPYGQSQTSGQLHSNPPFTPLGMEAEHSLVSAYSVQWLVTTPFFSC